MGKSKDEGPSAEEERSAAQDYWNNLSKWQEDATSRRDKNISGINARYSESGAKLRGILIGEEEKSYADRMKSINEGEHGKALQKYKDKMAGEATRNAMPKGTGGIAGALERQQWSAGPTKSVIPSQEQGMMASGPIGDVLNANREAGKTAWQSQIAQANAAGQAINDMSLSDYYSDMFGKPDEEAEADKGVTTAQRAASGGVWA